MLKAVSRCNYACQMLPFCDGFALFFIISRFFGLFCNRTAQKGRIISKANPHKNRLSTAYCQKKIPPEIYFMVQIYLAAASSGVADCSVCRPSISNGWPGPQPATNSMIKANTHIKITVFIQSALKYSLFKKFPILAHDFSPSETNPLLPYPAKDCIQKAPRRPIKTLRNIRTAICVILRAMER